MPGRDHVLENSSGAHAGFDHLTLRSDLHYHQRSARIKVPDLVRLDAMEAGLVALPQKKINGGGEAALATEASRQS